ncbi:ABC transporter substrate-binding protein [Oharaeibacter diazotrophicus]|uniref:Glycine betaine/proline transport system substrate-binding protein n=1 Tax=Oharaeibacter diazotrophicus TaxID=1920512 RepID=A0A4R6RKH2_9HYPH|nr:ABC transporter substrate-binding protein [Oharaeibacter diazotrophicus]TDP87073.1 glycine betaine/proline transport system substrate-binding protein [Oharaeibacter diazotrophicus]BBE70984.1 glycine betaine transporter periplasmic subunit [Pleomorphomonas sp. SM30]GLS77734.1 ABC transporter substrate-binding protein [Oharaeibacter diazotrophicus]
MNKLLATAVIAAGCGLCQVGTAAAADCGHVTIANMNWQSAEVLAWIDKIVLSSGYGCDAELVAGDTQPTLTSMIEKGEPDVAPEAWVNAMRDLLDKAVAEGKLAYAGESLSDGGVEGWWIPKYLAEAHPDIKSIPDALKHPELFPDPEDNSKAAVYNCPQGWNCQVTTANFYKAYGAQAAGFNLIDTGSAAGLDGSIAKAYEAKQGWLGYYWAPTAILGRYEMVKLDMAATHDKAEWDRCSSVPDCADPKPNAWAKSEVFTVVTSRFKDAGGPAYEYLTKRSWKNETVNKLLAWMSDNQADGEAGAKYFLKNNPDVWTPWVSPEAAEKVKAAVAG